ncbi:MAG: hypothetical protein IJ800_00910, partial [Clostridia bacterium]|nr:hypothetical protein [Clostridia bacterium]
METKKVRLFDEVFPCRWQEVVFLNYGYVKSENIAKVLQTSEEIVVKEAERLGLGYSRFKEERAKKGYITTIRNNWYLLPEEDIATLVDFTREKLEFTLKNEDFLDVKLGNFKPETPKVLYRPLSEEEQKKTASIAAKLSCFGSVDYSRDFEFFGEKSTYRGVNYDGIRIVHGYLTPCGDPFMENGDEYMPDELIIEYANSGITGVFVHGLLSALSPYPFDENASKDYKTRRENLKRLVARCEKYGIKVYLYFNEPRAIKKPVAYKYPALTGRDWGDEISLCFSKKQTEEYLYNAVYGLFSEIPDLGGVMTITMSEYHTHCASRRDNDCPYCKNIPAEGVAAKINNIFLKAIKDSGSKGVVIANLWGWSAFSGWTDEQVERGIKLLDNEIIVMCVSEYDLKIEKGGEKSSVIDYSISNPGPSEVTITDLGVALKSGKRVMAKIQINNSWECSAVPCLPVFELIKKHLDNLDKIGIRDYLLTWTLGGYPSPVMNMISSYTEKGDKFDLNEWYKEYFGQEGDKVKEASELLSEGFKEYPFSVEKIYFGPHTLGPSNRWSLSKQENKSTMVCYAFDDYETWIKPYSLEVYLSQMEKTCEK